MGRVRGSGQMGPTRSTRLPAALDDWLESRLALHPDRSVSEILLQLIHGGLRLRDGYMAIHRRTLEGHHGDPAAYATYRACLLDTFGSEYVEHLERWLEADGIAAHARANGHGHVHPHTHPDGTTHAHGHVHGAEHDHEHG